MNENQACQSQVHVKVLRYLRVKPRTRGLDRRLNPGLRGEQETDGQRTLVRGHHARTQRTARNFFNSIYNSSTPNRTEHYYFLVGKTI